MPHDSLSGCRVARESNLQLCDVTTTVSDVKNMWNYKILRQHSNKCPYLLLSPSTGQLCVSGLSHKKALAMRVSTVSPCLNVPTNSWGTWDTMVPFMKRRKAILHEVGVTCTYLYVKWVAHYEDVHGKGISLGLDKYKQQVCGDRSSRWGWSLKWVGFFF